MKPLAALWIFACIGALAGSAPDNYSAFNEARKLQGEGHEKEAFVKFLAIPGGESAAAALAGGAAGEYLALLRDSPGALQSPRAMLVEADLLLATGQRVEAINRYRVLAALASKNNWGISQAPYYPVEPPQRYGGEPYLYFLNLEPGQPNQPFSCGPGSHRDNWLLRRLLAFDLADEASRELARIWEVHRANTQHYAMVTPARDAKGRVTGEEKRLVRPSGFNSYGLQFALDYAFFLKHRGQTNEALALLLEPLRVMDMDRDPNNAQPEPLPDSMGALPVKTPPAVSPPFGFGLGTAGVSRKEYLRLVYGEFKGLGREGALIGELHKELEAGDNRARRLLAQVLLHEGQMEPALLMELDYIAHGDFDALTSAYRRGLMYEEYKHNAEAVVEFEKVLAIKPSPTRLPDADERILEEPYPQASAAAFPARMPGREAAPTDTLRVQDRLVRLYSALGRMDRAMEIELAQFESDEGRLHSPEAIDQMAQRFKAANQEARFQEWARAKIASAKTPLARANLAWQQRDYPTALTNAAAACSGRDSRWDAWRERFARLGLDQERSFMRAIVEANPRDAVARLALLDLEDRLEGAQAIAALEALLASDAGEAFPRGKGAWNRTRFESYMDLAYRLMRLYERDGQLEKLRALGLRIAKGEKPFDRDDGHFYRSDENGVDDLGNACLALAVQYAEDKSYRDQLLAALKASRWVGARAQIERRVGARTPNPPGAQPGANATGVGPSPAWANVPETIQIFTSFHQAAPCLARDDQFVYAGMPWGLAVYDLKGSPVARLALACPVQAMVVTQQQVWLGTPAGLFRAGTGGALPANPTPIPGWSVSHHPVGNVTALALDGEDLWIALPGEVKTLNRRTLELRSVSLEDSKVPQVGVITRILPDGEYVWTDGDCGLLRYDRASGTWSAPPNPGLPRYLPHLIGFIDGQPWVDVYLDDELRHRPARVDRKTFSLAPLVLDGNPSRNARLINEGFTYLGKDNGRPVFRADGRWFVPDEASARIRRLPEVYSSGKRRITDPVPDGLPLPGWDMARAAAAWPDGLRVGYCASAWPDRWPEGAVWAVVFEDARQQAWLCTGAGLALLRPGLRGLEHFGFAEGVNSGPMLDGLELGGKVYFATGWDDARGGLTVYDPQTSVFSTFFRCDGMDSEKVIGLAARDGRLELRFGIEYLRYAPDVMGDRRYRACPPCRFDPATRRFTPTGQPQIIDPTAAQDRGRSEREDLGPMPFLGGRVARRYEHDGRTWLCGEPGLVVLPKQESAGPVFASLAIKTLPSLDQSLREEAARVTIRNPIAPETLRTLVASTNRYVRANALAAAMIPVAKGQDGYASAIGKCVEDPYLQARVTAVWLLNRLPGQSEASLAPLRKALDDAEPCIRAVAAIALARRGQRPPLTCFEEVLASRNPFSNDRYGAGSALGGEADQLLACQVLAPGADRETFEFLLRHPLEPSTYPAYAQVLASLGSALRKHPDAAEPLLHAYDPKMTWPSQVQFAQAVFKSAGKDLLPVFHRALASKDRVVRSNAARACGVVGDPSSITPLLDALDMESGLARASIVWALGELKAGDAIPKLVELYANARNAEHNRRAAAGFLAQQAMAADRAQYTALRNLDAIASDWDELKAAATARPTDPRRDEELLSADLVLEAVHKIGPPAREFYRALSGATEASDRAEAAVGLAGATGADQDKNRAILNNLRADTDPGVRVRALVSLLVLGDHEVEAGLRDRLTTANESEQGEILQQLARLPGRQLQFARKEIEAIAGSDRLPQFLRGRAAPLLSKLEAGN